MQSEVKDWTPETFVLGLDVGGTKLAAGVVSNSGRLLGYEVIPTLIGQGPDRTLERLFELGRRVMDKAGAGRVAAIGIGCGGPLDAASGVVLSPVGMPGWVEVPVADRATESLGAAAFLDNDGTAGAWGEYLFGQSRSTGSLAYLTVGTGVGGGMVLGGRPYRGTSGNGVEFGHLVIDWRGRLCHCGQLGCAEAYVSGTSIAERAAEGLVAGAESCLGDVGTVTAADVAAAAAAGDEFAVQIWDESMAILARLVAQVINAVEPELVVLGGGLTQAGEMLIKPVRRLALAQVMSPSTTRTRVVLASRGPGTGVLGAAAIAFERLSTGIPA